MTIFDSDFSPAILFGLSFASTLLLMPFGFVYLYPRSSVFWKRSDYVYFGFAIVGALIVIIDLNLRGRLKEIQDIQILRAEAIIRVSNGVSVAMQTCDDMDRAKAAIDRAAEERRYGIVEPAPDHETGKVWSAVAYWYSEEQCEDVSSVDAWLKNKAVRTEMDFEKAMEVLLREGLDAFVTPQPPDFAKLLVSTEKSRRSKGSRFYVDIGEWIEKIASYNEKEYELQARVQSLSWFHSIRVAWPLLLGIALAIRLVRIHAEARIELQRQK